MTAAILVRYSRILALRILGEILLVHRYLFCGGPCPCTFCQAHAEHIRDSAAEWRRHVGREEAP